MALTALAGRGEASAREARGERSPAPWLNVLRRKAAMPHLLQVCLHLKVRTFARLTIIHYIKCRFDRVPSLIIATRSPGKVYQCSAQGGPAAAAIRRRRAGGACAPTWITSGRGSGGGVCIWIIPTRVHSVVADATIR